MKISNNLLYDRSPPTLFYAKYSFLVQNFLLQKNYAQVLNLSAMLVTFFLISSQNYDGDENVYSEKYGLKRKTFFYVYYFF